MKLKLWKRKDENKVKLSPIPKEKLVAPYLKHKVSQLSVPFTTYVETSELPFEIQLPPPSPLPKQIKPEIHATLETLTPTYKLYIGRIIRTITGSHTPSENAIVDVSEGTRLFVLGASGAGKTNLCKVFVEEYFKNTPSSIFIFDMESEYIMMGRPNEDPKLVDLLGNFGLEPQSFPVRALSIPQVLEDDEFKTLLNEYNCERYPLRIDPNMISSDLLQLLIGPSPTTKAYCDAVMRVYREMPEKSLDSLMQAVSDAGLPTQMKKRLLLTLEGLRGMIMPLNLKSLIENRKINVFFFPAEYFPSASERVFWAVFFANFVMSLAYTYQVGALAVMDEAGEFARGELTERMVKTNIAGLYRRGRKRRIDSILASNIGGVLEDVKMNVKGVFYFRIPETALSKSMEAKAVIRKDLEPYVTSIKDYQAIMDFPAEGETYIISVRPAQSYLPVKKKKEEKIAGPITLI
ncbi:MAG: hypothetical protein DSO07_08375 [Thermoproteota archaeon]|jgi:energy-coupling factor transporter ATP-binding protein EcfA2|uniref:ATP-binding protein n=1 Tax=Candidatus Methanodesulfokora washburnensis TaxID=2478471 RepID=A0A3R9R0U7_9CREN|nr:DUF87 domain-containing protein [Candidatus Methanodesulfokores washburnensis]RSN78320.1 ATP-binding protein [Candidatus Methanodesulfokores washburnensis]RZN61925.1 MAG: ATP-binding protein [Candidatus Methanodesulfokores washburnensis]TDA40706.1 MAG: hypothetical protein DSO07_08375 [Candidatus Korarchaeota archaeon]